MKNVQIYSYYSCNSATSSCVLRFCRCISTQLLPTICDSLVQVKPLQLNFNQTDVSLAVIKFSPAILCFSGLQFSFLHFPVLQFWRPLQAWIRRCLYETCAAAQRMTMVALCNRASAVMPTVDRYHLNTFIVTLQVCKPTSSASCFCNKAFS